MYPTFDPRPKITFNFGTTSTPTSGVPKTAATATPAFSFGSTAASTPAPNSTGSSATPAASPATPSFSFGGTAPAAGAAPPTPSFSFGATPDPAAISFGSKATPTPAAPGTTTTKRTRTAAPDTPFSFGGTSAATPFSFGGTSAATPAVATPAAPKLPYDDKLDSLLTQISSTSKLRTIEWALDNVDKYGCSGCQVYYPGYDREFHNGTCSGSECRGAQHCQTKTSTVAKDALLMFRKGQGCLIDDNMYVSDKDIDRRRGDDEPKNEEKEAFRDALVEHVFQLTAQKPRIEKREDGRFMIHYE